MKKTFSIFFGALFLLMPLVADVQAQSREYIRNCIKQRGECRNVAITKTNGDLMLYGQNGYAVSGCPKGLVDALDELNERREYISDVQLTENGQWLVLYGENGIMWSDIPSSLESKLRDFNNKGEKITSVTFNDANQWVVITTEHISASEGWIQDWLVDGLSSHGQLWAVCITGDAMVAVYENGYKFYGEVPDDLRSALKESTLDVFRLKIAGTAWFFADKKGNYRYNM